MILRTVGRSLAWPSSHSTASGLISTNCFQIRASSTTGGKAQKKYDEILKTIALTLQGGQRPTKIENNDGESGERFAYAKPHAGLLQAKRGRVRRGVILSHLERSLHPRQRGTLRKEETASLRPPARHGKPRRYGKRKSRPVIQARIDDAFGRPENELIEEDAAAESFPTPWKLRCGCILERTPVITQLAEDWEVEFEEAQMAMQEASSKQYPEDFLEEEIRGAKDVPAYYVDEDGKEYIEGFLVPDRETEADKKNNRRSLERQLDRKLYLVVKPKGKKDWEFPSDYRVEDEVMREGALRVLADVVGDKAEIYPLGYPPVAFDQYALSESTQKKEKVFGEKVFYYRSQLISGRPRFSRKLIDDFAWVSRDEFPEYFDPRKAKYFQHVVGLR